MFYSEERAAYGTLIEGLPPAYVDDVYRMEERAFRRTFEKEILRAPVYIRIHPLGPKWKVTPINLDDIDLGGLTTKDELIKKGVPEYRIQTEVVENEHGVIEDTIQVKSPENFPDLDF